MRGQPMPHFDLLIQIRHETGTPGMRGSRFGGIVDRFRTDLRLRRRGLRSPNKARMDVLQ